MSVVRLALFSNALFSASIGLLAAAAPNDVARWLGSVPPSDVRVVGLSLLVFAVAAAMVARARRPGPLPVRCAEWEPGSLGPSLRQLAVTMTRAATGASTESTAGDGTKFHPASGWLVVGALGLGCSGCSTSASSEPSGATDPAQDTTTEVPPRDGLARTEFEGLSLTYEAYGEGEPAIVFIHGGISTREVWAQAMEAWRMRRRVVALDLPGHGASDPPPLYTRAVFEGAVLAVMDAADVEEVVIVGHSFGVSVARDVALAAPDRVSGLMMLDGFLVPLGGDPAVGNAVAEPFRGAGWEDAAETFVEQFMLADNTPADAAAFVREMMLSGSQEQWVGILDLAIDEQVERDDIVDVPVFGTFLPGLTLPPEYEAYLRARFPDLEFELQPTGTGHFIMLERPAAFDTSLGSLVGRVGS